MRFEQPSSHLSLKVCLYIYYITSEISTIYRTKGSQIVSNMTHSSDETFSNIINQMILGT